jgi:hypothetical protein
MTSAPGGSAKCSRTRRPSPASQVSPPRRVLREDASGQSWYSNDTTTKHLAWGGLAIGAALAVVCPPAGIAAIAGGRTAGDCRARA